jgi:hypothetical protein
LNSFLRELNFVHLGELNSTRASLVYCEPDISISVRISFDYIHKSFNIHVTERLSQSLISQSMIARYCISVILILSRWLHTKI